MTGENQNEKKEAFIGIKPTNTNIKDKINSFVPISTDTLRHIITILDPSDEIKKQK